VGIDIKEPRKVTISLDTCAKELRGVVRHGLPVDRRTAGELLPHLRNVVARADHPDDPFSRVDAFNKLIIRLLTDLEDEPLAEAARILFAIADDTKGTNLTVRRQKCAELLQYDVDHFRKRVEAKIMAKMAEAFYRDLLRYKARTRTWATAYEVGRPRPPLDDEDISREEELISRIWQVLYELRAERIASELADSEVQAEMHRQMADLAAALLREHCARYVADYGSRFIPNGELEYTIEGLEKLVVWQSADR
jgi:hypothetical protein